MAANYDLLIQISTLTYTFVLSTKIMFGKKILEFEKY